MKVIGKVDSETYLVQIGHKEIEKFLGLYYSQKGKLLELKVGEVVDLGKGHDFAADITQAMNQTRMFIEKNKSVVNAIINGLRIEDLNKAAKEEDHE